MPGAEFLICADTDTMQPGMKKEVAINDLTKNSK
jgi:hypothetical protein